MIVDVVENYNGNAKSGAVLHYIDEAKICITDENENYLEISEWANLLV